MPNITLAFQLVSPRTATQSHVTERSSATQHWPHTQDTHTTLHHHSCTATDCLCRAFLLPVRLPPTRAAFLVPGWPGLGNRCHLIIHSSNAFMTSDCAESYLNIILAFPAILIVVKEDCAIYSLVIRKANHFHHSFP